MPRMSIYVPDEMKAEIDAIGGGTVNWSNAAQSAFAREIQRIKWPKEPTMDAVIERLRASKATFEEREKIEGQKAGREWAMQQADYDQLRAIGQLELEGNDYWRAFDAALGNDILGWRNIEDSFWWEARDGGGAFTPPTDEYVEAFVTGAKEVWNEVADKI